MLSNKKILVPILTTLLVILIAVVALVGRQIVINRKIDNGYKQITVEVVSNIEGKEYKKTYEYWTKEGILGKALDENNFNMEYDNFENFRMIHTIDGISTDSSKEEFWKLFHNDKESMVGMDDLVIKHGDKIKFEFTVGFYKL